MEGMHHGQDKGEACPPFFCPLGGGALPAITEWSAQ